MLDIVLKMIISGGWVMVPLFILSVAAWVIIIDRYYFLRDADFSRYADAPPASRSDFERLVEKRGGVEKTVLGEFLSELGGVVKSGTEAVENCLKEKMIFAEQSLNQRLSLLAALAAIAPLLGLLGTVGGMINTFQVITVYGNGNPNLMSAGISEAMLTTQTGLLAALPIMLFHNYLKNRAKRILDEARSVSNVYLSLALATGEDR